MRHRFMEILGDDTPRVGVLVWVTAAVLWPPCWPVAACAVAGSYVLRRMFGDRRPA